MNEKLEEYDVSSEDETFINLQANYIDTLFAEYLDEKKVGNGSQNKRVNGLKPHRSISQKSRPLAEAMYDNISSIDNLSHSTKIEPVLNIVEDDISNQFASSIVSTPVLEEHEWDGRLAAVLEEASLHEEMSSFPTRPSALRQEDLRRDAIRTAPLIDVSTLKGLSASTVPQFAFLGQITSKIPESQTSLDIPSEERKYKDELESSESYTRSSTPTTSTLTGEKEGKYDTSEI